MNKLKLKIFYIFQTKEMKLNKKYYCALICLFIFSLITNVSSRRKVSVKAKTKSIIYFSDQDKILEILVNNKKINWQEKVGTYDETKRKLKLNPFEGDTITIRTLKSDGRKKRDIVLELEDSRNPAQKKKIEIKEKDWKTEEEQIGDKKRQTDRADIKVSTTTNDANTTTDQNNNQNTQSQQKKGCEAQIQQQPLNNQNQPLNNQKNTQIQQHPLNNQNQPSNRNAPQTQQQPSNQQSLPSNQQKQPSNQNAPQTQQPSIQQVKQN